MSGKTTPSQLLAKLEPSEDVKQAILYGCAALGAWQLLRVGGDVTYGVWKHILRPRRNLAKRYGSGDPNVEPWAVVTGGADGIGRAYAEQLAAAGFSLCVIDKDSGRLGDLRSSIKNVKVETITFDFGDLGTVEGFDRLARQVKGALAGKDVAILVNNVAEFQHQAIVDASWSYVLRASNVNAHAYAAMTQLVLPGLLERQERRGLRSAILNVGTCAAEPQNPRYQFGIYGATKAYTHILSSSLQEMYGSKLDVMTVIPRQTETKMNPAGYMFTIQPSTHAKAVFDQLGYDATTYGAMTHCLEYNLRFKYTVFGLFDKYVQWCNLARNQNLVKLYDSSMKN